MKTFQKLSIVLFMLFAFSLVAQTTIELDINNMRNNASVQITPVPSNLNLDELFDGNLLNHSVSWLVNPIVVTIEFSKTQRFSGTGLWMENGEWSVESANNLSDLNNKSGSYRSLVSKATPNTEHTFTPTDGKFLRLTALEIGGDKVVHLQEWKINAEANLALSLNPNHAQLTAPVNTNIDFTVQARDDARGILINVPNTSATWTSTNAGVASVSSAGRLNTTSIGSANMRVDYGSLSTTLPIAVISETSSTATSLPPRGVAGDGWADIILGQRDFSEISPNEVTPYALFNPGGVFIDRDGTKDKLLVWDSGNNRVLGFELSDNASTPLTASLVLGQPSGYRYSGCNQESGFQNYPNRAPASAATLCGCDEGTFTITENKTFVTMAKDKYGNIYIPDHMNHRILKYHKPFETDAVADDVWGQADFTGNLANRVSRAHPSIPGSEPKNNADKNTLCFAAVGGGNAAIYIDDIGNMWVADGGNNRVLRYPFNPATKEIAKDADLVLGQPDFNKGGDYSQASVFNGTSWEVNTKLNGMYSPNGIIIKDNVLYVCDQGNHRILKFRPPFSNGMSASGTFGNFTDGRFPISIKESPDNMGFHVLSHTGNWGGKSEMLELDSIGNIFNAKQMDGHGYGSFDFDRSGKLYHTSYMTQQVYTYKKNGVNYEKQGELFQGGQMNVLSDKEFGKSVTGIEVTKDQLFVASYHRLYIFNDKDALYNGKAADDLIGSPSFSSPQHDNILEVEADKNNHLWVVKRTGGEPEIWLYNLPLTGASSPVKKLKFPFNVLGKTEKLLLNGATVEGVAATANSEYLWVVEAQSSRVFRIKDPMTNPVVDIILGQTEINGTQCNRGVIPAPNTGTPLLANMSMLCKPGSIELDNFENLYVSDHSLEAEGNWRMLMFKKETIQNTGSVVKMAIAATKEFPKSEKTWAWQPGFDSKNRMAVGYNIYSGARFVGVYNDPLGPQIKPDFYLNDYGTNPFEVEFDEHDNMYVVDLNRGRVLIYKASSGANPVADFYTALSSINDCGETTITLQNTSTNATSWLWSFPGGTPATSTEENPEVSYAVGGTYDVTLTAFNASGSDSKVIKGMVKIDGAKVLPLQEDFESATNIPDEWQVINPDADASWILSSNSSAYGKGSKSLAFNNYSSYSSNKIGERDAVYTPPYSLDGLSKAALTFDVASARYNNTWFDSLIVKISTDCGDTWSRVYAKGGSVLATAPDKRGGNFVPTATQWRTESINLDAYAGEPNVMLAFENWAGWGQWLYVDNILLSESPGGDVTGLEELEALSFEVFPNPNQGVFNISLPSSVENSQLTITNALGQIVYNTTNLNKEEYINLDLSRYDKGLYFVRLIQDDQSSIKRMIIK